MLKNGSNIFYCIILWQKQHTLTIDQIKRLFIPFLTIYEAPVDNIQKIYFINYNVKFFLRQSLCGKYC